MLLDRCFSMFCALKFSPVQKGAHSVRATPFQMSVIFPFISFSLSCLLQPSSTIFPSTYLSHFPLSLSRFLYLLYVAWDAQIAVSLFTPTCQLSPLPWRRTIVMATQTGWGAGGEAEQDRTQRNMKERDRQRVEKVGSLFSLNDKEGTQLLINVPLPVYQHKISGRHLL